LIPKHYWWNKTTSAVVGVAKMAGSVGSSSAATTACGMVRTAADTSVGSWAPARVASCCSSSAADAFVSAVALSSGS